MDLANVSIGRSVGWLVGGCGALANKTTHLGWCETKICFTASQMVNNPQRSVFIQRVEKTAYFLAKGNEKRLYINSHDVEKKKKCEHK